jgi:predicted O-methyltransferase YrrM
VDKHEYPRVLRKALPRLRRGGVLISDNVLRNGQVAGRAGPEDRAIAGGSSPERRAVAAVREYNRKAAAAEGCVYSILPLRDGVGVLLKQ